MPKNHTTLKVCTKLLRGARPSTILANDFAPDNDNAVWYSNPAAFLNVLGTAVQDLQAQGFSTMKSGSCFADLAGRRALNKVHYDEEYFDIDKAIVVPVLFDNDNDGAAMESEANNLEMMVNIRRNEAGHGARPEENRRW